MRYIYDGEDILLEYGESAPGVNTFVARYSHGDQVDQPLAVKRAGIGFFYYHADHQGSIINLTNSSGTIANSYLYDAYGRTLTVFESVSQPFTYTGRELDSESGLYYYRARYYDPNTGRFLGEDPIGFAAGDQNLYRYVLNNPVNLTDPDGENPVISKGIEALIKFLLKQLVKKGTDIDPMRPDPGDLEGDSDNDGKPNFMDPDSEFCRVNCDPDDNSDNDNSNDDNQSDNPQC